jgi:cytochrome c oxidase cbb3-type subunit 4
METYSTLRTFADSWFLIAMFAFFVGTWVFAFWPSLKSDRDAAARIPFRDGETDCPKTCSDCICKADLLKGPSNG